VKKKKNLKVATILSIWFGGELVHCWLSSNRVVIKNYGISFGIGGWFFIVLNIIFVLLLTKIWWKNNSFAIGLVVAGGWINIIDRMFLGYVRDYWQIGWVFNNLADWVIQVGVIIFLLEIWIKKLK